MPNSSRRKQSKPQHLPSEEEGGVAGNELNQPVTSSSPSVSAGAADTQEHEYGSTTSVTGEEEGGVAGNELNQPVTSSSSSFAGAADTQEHEYGSTSTVTGLNLKKNGENSIENDAEIDQDTSEAPSQDLTKMRKNFTNFLPHDLKMRSDVAGNGDLVIDDDLETEDDSVNGDENTKPFKSKHGLQYHQYMTHGKHPVDSDILQRYEFLRKRSLEESLIKTAGTGVSDCKVIGESSRSSGLESEPQEKRQRTDDIVSQQSSSSYNSAIIAGSTRDTDNGFDLRMSKPTDSGRAMSSEPDGQDLTRSCPICAKVFPKPSDLKRHMMCHTGEKPFRCEENTKPFKSKHGLQYHQYMTHGKHPVDSDILQRYEFLRKRSLEESLIKTAGTGVSDCKVIGESSRSSGLESEPQEKRQRTDDIVSQQSSSSYNSAIIAGSTRDTDNGFDLRMSKPTDSGRAMSSEPDGQDLTRSCPICAKVFPKPSDLKRHMMCHTGEKPFRCEYCNKPFRAKSSMHYHLKAAHGVQIELSPGLEERYLRMKTRASLGYYQRGHLSDSGLLRMDNHMDIDEIEDDCESTDSQSYYHTSGIGSDITDTKSQGHFNNTGNDGKSALDLSVTGRSKDRVGDSMTGLYGETIIQTESPFKKSRISIHNETVLVTRLDGLDIINGQNTSIYKCYLCGKMFQSMSKLQCHLSLHFEKQVVTYECCFCEEIFQFKTQLQNHIRRQHSTPLNKSKDTNENPGHPSTSNESDNQLSCRYCRKIFNKQISLNKHMRLHFWNKNCFCRICGKSFIQYTSLQVHMSRFHWKTVGKSKSSVLRRKINFFNTYRFKPESHDGIIANQSEEPLDLIKNTENRPMNGNLALIMPKSPLQNGDQSDAGASRHSSENNLSGYMSSSDMYDTEDGAEIKTAPKRSLMPFMRAEGSPRHKTHRKSTPNHLKPPTHVTSDNHVPLNFIKSESTHQDSNNNESVPHGSQPTTENKTLPPSLSERLIPPGYNMNATNHLLMAKALAAHQTLSHFTNTSQPMIFPPNHLPPSLAAMTQMMQLPVTVPSLSAETVANTSQSPSPASQTSSKSDTSPEDRDFTKEGAMRDSMLGFPRVPWSQGKSAADNWTFNMFSPADPGHTDGRKVSSLSRTHSRLGIVHTPINREAVCKPTTLTDGRTVYKCPFCSKEFVSFSDINRHMDFHEDIRPYKCQYCDYYARTNSQLKVHMMRHQGIREYCCKLCNYKGVTQSDLNRHMKSQIHMLKARNACTYCGEGFVTTKNLEKHLDGNCIVKMQKLNGGLHIPLTESIA